MVTSLRIRYQRWLPSRLLKVQAADLHKYIREPTIFDLRTQYKQPFFVSVLLHGNETSGWDAVRRFRRDYPSASMLVFIGNVQAAAKGMRHLPQEQDFNRVWNQMPWAYYIDELVHKLDPWCAIDIHNNSSPNPHYCVITDFRRTTLALAKMFSNRLIYTNHTQDILARALSALCPAITVETGTVDDKESVERAYQLMLTLSKVDGVSLWVDSVAVDEFEAYETIGIVRVTKNTKDLNDYPLFNPILEQCSFKTLKAGTRFVDHISPQWQISVENPATQQNLTDEFFDIQDSDIFLAKDVILSMFTSDPLLASQDCVCYFLKRRSLVSV